jgi:hypothetical protein
VSYLIWRLHRNQMYFAGLALVVLVVVLGVTGLVMSGDYHRALATCATTASCATLSESLFQGDGLIINVVNLSVVAPALLGLFWGAPLVAKEVDEGTHVLAWTQSVTRRRWMGTNLAAALLAAAVWGALLALLVSWWRIPENALFGRFAAFDVQGVVPVAYSVFAVALGIAVGAWLRRPLPALATTLGVLVAVRAVIGLYLRPHYLAPVRALAPLVTNVSGAPANAWLLTKDVVDASGHVVDTTASGFPPAACAGNDLVSCLTGLGYRRLVTFQPDSRYWTFQAVETGLFLALAALLAVLAYRAVVTRDA